MDAIRADDVLVFGVEEGGWLKGCVCAFALFRFALFILFVDIGRAVSVVLAVLGCRLFSTLCNCEPNISTRMIVFPTL